MFALFRRVEERGWLERAGRLHGQSSSAESVAPSASLSMPSLHAVSVQVPELQLAPRSHSSVLASASLFWPSPQAVSTQVPEKQTAPEPEPQASVTPQLASAQSVLLILHPIVE